MILSRIISSPQTVTAALAVCEVTFRISDGKIVKITDFNVSKFVDKSKHLYTGLSKENYKMWTYTGTIAFTAPEVLADTEYTYTHVKFRKC